MYMYIYTYVHTYTSCHRPAAGSLFHWGFPVNPAQTTSWDVVAAAACGAAFFLGRSGCAGVGRGRVGQHVAQQSLGNHYFA